MRRLSSLCGCLLTGGCYPQPSGESTYHEIAFRDPDITAIEASCEDDQWRFIVETNAWTGNGFIILKAEERSERHPLSSFEAGEDGDSDRLRVFLSVIPDWQNFSAGSSTGWLCSDEEQLSVAIAIQHPVDGSVSDCVYWGEARWDEFSSLDACELWAWE